MGTGSDVPSGGWVAGPCPVSQATTPSLEALKAYSLGVKASKEKGAADAIPFYKRAIELDPNFAMAYSDLGWVYGGLGEIASGRERT